MIDLHTWSTPNGRKASIMLEETGLPYRVVPVDLGNGAQRAPAFVRINPNGKIPAIVDHLPDGRQITVFESGAILVYLAEKSGKLLAPTGQARADALAWTFWQVGGLGPMLGQWMFFSRNASDGAVIGRERYRDETLRLLGVLESRLAQQPCLAGEFSIADIANFTWVRAAIDLFLPALGDDAPPLPAVRRWLQAVGARPGVQRGLAVPAPVS